MRKALKILLVLITFLAVSLACNTPPKLKVKTWAGDSEQAAIVRAQENLMIKCGDSAFDDYLCISYDDFRAIKALILKCRKWDYTGTEEMSHEDALLLWNELSDRLNPKNPLP